VHLLVNELCGIDCFQARVIGVLSIRLSWTLTFLLRSGI